MSDRESEPEYGPENLFRTEALEFVVGQRGPGELLRVSSTWTERAFWGLLVLIGIGLAAAALVQISGEPLLYLLLPALKSLHA